MNFLSSSSDLKVQFSYLKIFLGKLRYANNSNYKNDTMIRKEVPLLFNSNDTPGVRKPFCNGRTEENRVGERYYVGR